MSSWTFPRSFDQLNANTLTVNTELVINGTVSGTPNWGNTLPISTAGQRGIVELATIAEAAAGTDTERAVTPAGLQGAIDQCLTADDRCSANWRDSAHLRCCGKHLLAG